MYKSTILNYCMVSISILIILFRLPRSYLTIQIMIEICTRSAIYLFCLYNIFNKYYAYDIIHCNT